MIVLNFALIAIWIAVSTVGVAVWIFNLGRHWERLKLQERRHEASSLREIVMQQIRMDIICLAACIMALMLLILSLILNNDGSMRMVVGRILITGIVGALGLLGFQQMHDDTRIDDVVRQEMERTDAIP